MNIFMGFFITEILLKVALNTITQPNPIYHCPTCLKKYAFLNIVGFGNKQHSNLSHEYIQANI
jgi:hypothetical protein